MREHLGIRLLRLGWLFLWRPRRAVAELAEDPAPLGLGILFLLISLTVYSGVSVVYVVVGHRPAWTPLTLFPAEQWYLVQAFITIPIGLVTTFAYSGIAYAVCRGFGGRGAFDTTFASSAFSLHLPMALLMWIPEVLVAPWLYGASPHHLPWPAWIELLRMFLVPMPWAGIVSALALAKLHQISTPKALVAVLLGAAPTSLVAAAFLR